MDTPCGSPFANTLLWDLTLGHFLGLLCDHMRPHRRNPQRDHPWATLVGIPPGGPSCGSLCWTPLVVQTQGNPPDCPLRGFHWSPYCGPNSGATLGDTIVKQTTGTPFRDYLLGTPFSTHDPGPERSRNGGSRGFPNRDPRGLRKKSPRVFTQAGSPWGITEGVPTSAPKEGQQRIPPRKDSEAESA